VTVLRDELKPVREALEAQYAKLAAAVRNKDYDAFMALRTSDFSTVALKGGPQSTEQMAARTRLLLQVIQPPIDVKFIIVELNVKGDEAVATVRQLFSRMQQVAGQLRRLETAVTQDETWVRTPGGWKLKFVANERDLLKSVDGKPVDPLKPSDPNAPAYDPGTAGHTENHQARQIGQAEQEVRKLERAWLDAYERRDVEAMNRIVADDFTITFPNGQMQTKAQIISSLKGSAAAAGPSPKFYTEDVRSRAYGDTVILIGRVIAEWEQNGKKVREESRYTDTYVKRQGGWQVVASHLSNAPKP
jgi:ketosteroid isomerase-like protein